MKQISPELLKKYAQNLCTEQEKASVEEWLNSNNNILNDEAFKVSFSNEDIIKEDIWKGISKRNQTSKVFYLYQSLAAACIAGILITAGVLLLNKKEYDTNTVANIIRYTAPFGEPSILRLSDSSSIHLIGGSTISYSENFADAKQRILTLENGEIFLEVTHDTEKPFLVQSEGTIVKVLGTKFNVKNNVQDSLITITLNEGSIRFESAEQSPQLLKPGQQLLFNKIRQSTVNLHSVDLPMVTGWINKQLVFRDTRMNEVFEKIKSYYGISFIIRGKPDLNKLLTGTFDNMSLDETLNMITFSTGIKFKIQQQAVTVY